MWGRDKNCQVLMIFELFNRENKVSLIIVFLFVHPLEDDINLLANGRRQQFFVNGIGYQCKGGFASPCFS